MTKKEWEGSEWAEWVFKSEKILTMDKPLILTVCPVGALFSRNHNPHLPCTAKDLAREVIESYHEGASVAHLHTRDELGYPAASFDHLKETIDLIMDKCPDIIIQPSSCEGFVPGKTSYSYETVKPLLDHLHNSGKHYMESTIFTPVSYACQDIDGTLDITLATRDNMQKTISFLQNNGVKPEFMSHNWEGILNVKEYLIKPGILEKPYLMSMGPGMHNAAETSTDPWGYMYVLGMMKMMPEGSVVSLSAGGRNWLPLTTFAIMMGIDTVRVGMEDHLYIYPHRNEIVKSNAEETRKVANIARELGRDIATPAEARKILGIA